jgi:hypothetical protein
MLSPIWLIVGTRKKGCQLNPRAKLDGHRDALSFDSARGPYIDQAPAEAGCNALPIGGPVRAASNNLQPILTPLNQHRQPTGYASCLLKK